MAEGATFYPTPNGGATARPNYMESFLRAFQTMSAIRQQQEQQDAQREERAMQLQLRKHELKRDEVLHKMSLRKSALDEIPSLERLPGVVPPLGPDGVGPPEMAKPAQPFQHLPGVPEAGLPDMDAPVRSLEQVLQQLHMNRMQEASDKSEASMIDIPEGMAEKINPAMKGMSRIDPDLLKALPPSFTLPPGMMEGGPLAGGGTVPQAMIPVLDSAMQRSTTRSEGAANRANSLKIANINASARRSAGSGADIPDDDIRAAADGVASGEFPTIGAAQLALGGVKSRAGIRIWKQLAKDGNVVVDPKTRQSLGKITAARAVVDQMEDMAKAVNAAKDPVERAKASMLLEQYGQSTAAIMARGFGETGQMNEGDIRRARGLAVGWKAANFAPEYAQREIDLLRGAFDRVEDGVVHGAIRTFKRPGAAGAPAAGAPAAGGFDRSNSYGRPVGAKIQGPSGVLTWDGREWK